MNVKTFSKPLPLPQNICNLHRISDNAMDYLVLDFLPFLSKFSQIFLSHSQLVHSCLKLYISRIEDDIFHLSIYSIKWTYNWNKKQLYYICLRNVPDTTPEKNNTRQQKIVPFIVILFVVISLPAYCRVLRILSALYFFR